MPPKCRPPKSYLPRNSRNTTLQGEEHGDQNIEDRVLDDPMDEDEVNRFIQDTFAPLDHEDNLYDIYDVPLLKKSQEPLYEGSTTNILSAIFFW